VTREILAQWIDELAKPNPKYAGQATCPFAQSAWRQGSVGYEDCRELLATRAAEIVGRPIGARKMHVLEFNPHFYSVDIIAGIVEEMNTKLPDLLVLYIHPDDDEPSHSTLGLVLIQRRDDMMEAIEALRKTAYFDNNPLPEWYDDA
jgi:hypothetical protein